MAGAVLILWQILSIKMINAGAHWSFLQHHIFFHFFPTTTTKLGIEGVQHNYNILKLQQPFARHC